MKSPSVFAIVLELGFSVFRDISFSSGDVIKIVDNVVGWYDIGKSCDGIIPVGPSDVILVSDDVVEAVKLDDVRAISDDVTISDDAVTSKSKDLLGIISSVDAIGTADDVITKSGIAVLLVLITAADVTMGNFL